MLFSLSWALGRASTESDPLYEHKSESANSENCASIVTKAGDILNNLIHKEKLEKLQM